MTKPPIILSSQRAPPKHRFDKAQHLHLRKRVHARLVGDPCQFRHKWDEGLPPKCSRCGVDYPCTPQELYRYTKMARGLPLQQYRADGKPDRRSETGKATRLACPRCKHDTLVLGQVYHRKKKRRWVRCCQCGYSWRTVSKEAFGGTRQVELRG